jgi:integrase
MPKKHANLYKRKDGKSPYWWYYFFYNGKMYRGSTGTTDIKQADDFFDSEKNRIKREVNREIAIEEAGNISIDEWLVKYIKHVQEESDRFDTIKTYRTFGNNLKEFLSKNGQYKHIRLLKEITPQIIKDFKSYKLESCKKRTVFNNINGIKKMLKWALKENYITTNPIADIDNYSKKRVESERDKPVVLSLEEFDRLSTYTKRHYPYLYALYMTFMYTGARKREIYSLQWRDIDFQNKCIHIRRKEGFIPKTDERDMPIHNKLANILNEIPKGTDYDYVFLDENGIPFMFPDKDKRKGVYESHKPNRILHKIARDIGKPEFKKIHWLRHSFATIVAKKYGLAFARVLLGHRDIETTQKYIHIDKEEIQEMLNRSKELDKIFK